MALIGTLNQAIKRGEPILAMGSGDFDGPGLVVVGEGRLVVASMQLGGARNYRSFSLADRKGVIVNVNGGVRLLDAHDNVALLLTSVDRSVSVALGEVVGVVGCSPDGDILEQAGTAILQNIEDMEAGRIAAAGDRFEEARRLGDADGTFFLGVLASDRDDSEMATRLWKAGADEGNISSARLLSNGQLGAGDHSGAIMWLKRARALGHPDAMRTIGAMYVAQGKLDLAEASFVTGVDDGDPECAFQLMLLHVQNGKPQMMDTDIQHYVERTLRRSLKDQIWAFIYEAPLTFPWVG